MTSPKTARMQHICVDCGVTDAATAMAAGAAADAATSTTDTAADTAAAAAVLDPLEACSKCSKPLQPPTVFDCARLGLLDDLQQLIKQTPDFDVNALEPTSNATLLHHAAVNNKMRVLEFLVCIPHIHIDALGGDLQTTPLFWAAFHNHIYAVALLKRHGADAGFMDAAGFNAFLLAIQRCFPITAAYLVATGTDIDIRMNDPLKRTALMLLATRERFHLDSFRMVLGLEATVNLQDTDGNTALHHAAKSDVGLAVRMLLDAGADPTILNAAGETPLALALAFAHPKSATRHLLLEDAQLQHLAHWTHVPKRTLEANVYKLAFLVPWVYLVTAAWIIANANTLVAFAWQQTLLLALTIAFVRLLQRGSYGNVQKAAALLFGINLSSIVSIACSYAVRYSLIHFYSAAVATSVALTLVCLYDTVTRDAGVVRMTTLATKLASIRRLVELKARQPTKLCLTCLHARPLRSKHCPEVRGCIAKFDHYCPFTLNAIGACNYKSFVGFVASAEAGIVLVLLAHWQSLCLTPAIDWTHGVIAWVVSVGRHEPLLAGIAVVGVIEALWIGYLLAFHLYLIATAQTTYEFIKRERGSANAFAYASSWENCVAFARREAIDWRSVLSIEDVDAAQRNEERATKRKAQ